MNCLDANFIAALHFNVARQTETAERFVRSGLTRGNRGNGEKGVRFLRYLLSETWSASATGALPRAKGVD